MAKKIDSDLTVTGNISGATIYGDGSNLTNLPSADLSAYTTLSTTSAISGSQQAEIDLNTVKDTNIPSDDVTLEDTVSSTPAIATLTETQAGSVWGDSGYDFIDAAPPNTGTYRDDAVGSVVDSEVTGSNTVHKVMSTSPNPSDTLYFTSSRVLDSIDVSSASASLEGSITTVIGTEYVYKITKGVGVTIGAILCFVNGGGNTFYLRFWNGDPSLMPLIRIKDDYLTTLTTDIATTANISGANIHGTFIGDGSGLTSVTGTDSTKLPLAGGTMTGNLDMDGNALRLKGSGTQLAALGGGSPYAIRIDANNVTNTDFGDTYTTIYLPLNLANGTSINEFSIDGTLAGNSDDAVPTEKAVKTYADTKLALAGGTVSGNLTVSGDLIVSGTTTTLDSQTVLIEDNIITLNSNVTGGPVLDSGVEVERGSSTNARIIWNETSDFWAAGISGSEEQLVVSSDLSSYLPLAGGSMTGAILAPDDDSGNPSYSFSNSPSTGFLYNSGNDSVGLDINGNNIFTAEESSSNTFLYTDLTLSGNNIALGGFLEISATSEPTGLESYGRLYFDSSSNKYRINEHNTGWKDLYRNLSALSEDITTTGNITGNAFVGDGSGLTSVTGTDSTKLPLAGGTVTGSITMSTGTASFGFTNRSSASVILSTLASGESFNRLRILTDGTIYFGDGSTPGLGDTILYRGGADLLQTDDAFKSNTLESVGGSVVGGALTVVGDISGANIHGTFIGDGSGLTGVVKDTGDTVSGELTIAGTHDMNNAPANSVDIAGGYVDVTNGLRTNKINANTAIYVGDGAQAPFGPWPTDAPAGEQLQITKNSINATELTSGDPSNDLTLQVRQSTHITMSYSEGAWSGNPWDIGPTRTTFSKQCLFSNDVFVQNELRVVGSFYQQPVVTSTTPTSADLTTIFGSTPADIGEGFTSLLSISGDDKLWQVVSDGAAWWTFAGTKAT